MEKNAIIVGNLKKIYGKDKTMVEALKGISFTIPANKITAILGPSGSGKSTLLHLIGCLDKPTSGKIFLDGKDISKLNDNQLAKLRNEKIGFIFQSFNLHPLLTAIENVELPEIIKGTNEKIRKEKAKKLLKIIGLEKRAHHLPSELSGGEQQRVAIARALINDPKIILADEPTGNLDTKNGKEIIKFLISLKNKATIVIITHDIEIAKHADHIIKIRDGQIVYQNGIKK